MRLREKIKKIKLLLLDVDGVLTNGQIIIDDKGNEIKNFNVKDGHGIKLLQRAGIEVGVITGRESNVVLYRMKELGIKLIYQKSFDKLKILDEIIKEKNLDYSEIAYCGDDVVDLPVMRKVGVKFSVNNAHKLCKELADFVTEKNGGEGAVREIVELILKFSENWEKVHEKYLL